MCSFKQTGKWACGNISQFKCPSPESSGKCPGFQQKPRAHRVPPSKLKGLAIPPGVTFTYYGKPQGGAREHKGVITVAMRVQEHVIYLGFSFCSPKDPWHKIQGRDLALKRLHDDAVVVPYLYSPKQTARDVVAAVALHDWPRLSFQTFQARVPDWTKKLGKRMGVRRVSKISKLYRFKAAPGSLTPSQILGQMKAEIDKLQGLSLSQLIDEFDPNG
jgi:hypothetical protein